MLTRAGVCYDLTKTPYEVIIRYSTNELKFKFSSEYNLNNFNSKLEENRDRLTESFTKRFGFSVSNDLLADLKLYEKIEKRGFLIESKEGLIKCIQDISLLGMEMILR